MAKNIEPDYEPDDEPEYEADVEEGWHVVGPDGLLGVFETEADAEAYAEAHPRAAGVDVEIFEVE